MEWTWLPRTVLLLLLQGLRGAEHRDVPGCRWAWAITDGDDIVGIPERTDTSVESGR